MTARKKAVKKAVAKKVKPPVIKVIAPGILIVKHDPSYMEQMIIDIKKWYHNL